MQDFTDKKAVLRDSYAGRAPARADNEGGESAEQGDIARHALQIILETAEYVSDRTVRLSVNVAEGSRAGQTLGAVARQIRTLSSNTSLEASRLGGNATVAEIARQMRLLSQQVTALGEHLSACLRSQDAALGELSGAIDALLADTAATQALFLHEAVTTRDGDEGVAGGGALNETAPSLNLVGGSLEISTNG